MDFSHEAWDVGCDADQLTSSLFGDTEIASKPTLKRKHSPGAESLLETGSQKKKKKSKIKDEDNFDTSMETSYSINAKEEKVGKKSKNKHKEKQTNGEKGRVVSKSVDKHRLEENCEKNGFDSDVNSAFTVSEGHTAGVEKANVHKNKKRKGKDVLGAGVKITASQVKDKINIQDKIDLSKLGRTLVSENEESGMIDARTETNEKLEEISPKKRKKKCKKNKFKDKIVEDSKSMDNERKSEDLGASSTKEIGTNVISSSEQETRKKRKKKCKRNKFKEYVDSSKDAADLNVATGETSVKSKTKKSKDLPNCAITESVPNKGSKLPFNPTALHKILSASSGTESSNHPVGQKKSSTEKESSKVKPSEMKSYKGTVDKKTSNKAVPEDTNTTGDTAPKRAKSLLEKNRERLNAARFRYLNEQLYTTTGREALEMFRGDKQAFKVYHEGFQGQVEKWPTNPVDVIIKDIQAKPKTLVVADFGCGDAKLARSVPNKVHSFDLVALNDRVTVCDMTKVPLAPGSVDTAVFCLSLMGTNLVLYLQEANRVLRNGGRLKVAEVISRFENVGDFVSKVEKMGFRLLNKDMHNKLFIMMDFKKVAATKGTPGDITLLPCMYKKR